MQQALNELNAIYDDETNTIAPEQAPEANSLRIHFIQQILRHLRIKKGN